MELPSEPNKKPNTNIPLIVLAHDAQQFLNRKIEEHSVLFKFIKAGCLLALLALLYFWREIKNEISKQTVEVASISLEDAQVQEKVREISEEVLDSLVMHYTKDPETIDLVVVFLRSIIEDPQTTQSVIYLVSGILDDPSFQDTATHLAQFVVLNVCNEPYTKDQIVVLLESVLMQKETQNLISDLLVYLFKDPYLRSEAEKLAKWNLQGRYNKEKVHEIALNSMKYILNDKTVITTAQKKFTSIMNDPHVHEIFGSAIKASLKFIFIPSILRDPGSSTVSTEDTKTIPEKVEDVNLLVVEEQYIPEVCEVIYKQVYEKVCKRWGIQITYEGLNEKISDFYKELDKEKKNLSPPLKSYLDRFSNKNHKYLFSKEMKIIEMGGKEYLIKVAKEKTHMKIKIYEEYLQKAEKTTKNYSFSPVNWYYSKSTSEMSHINQIIKNLKLEGENETFLLDSELQNYQNFLFTPSTTPDYQIQNL